jgi:hypothetical protein
MILKHTQPYSHVFKGVTIDGLWVGEWIHWTLYTHHSELQVIRVLSLISTLYKTPQQPLRVFPACCVFNSRSLATTYNTEDLSASRVHFDAVRRTSRNWTVVRLKVKVTLRLAVYRQSVRLGVKPLETHDQISFQLSLCGNSPYVTSSLTRRWICLLWICLAFCQVYV